ncbi:hypothetical protein MPER_11959, partial [Moniliophthora perniciosa FA553]
LATSKLFVDPAFIERAEKDEFAKIENLYFVNDGFMRDGQLLEKQEIDKIGDHTRAATTAWALKKVTEFASYRSECIAYESKLGLARG